ncbi:nuclear receptor ROR-gamma-like, partial [Neopelma chrysocephalum]|uniref:nuclear receptor ROR-gamma-like n=1 Tax=Neopelma chrysocephalum TaxID=114329 RepID=UPI000FCD1032
PGARGEGGDAGRDAPGTAGDKGPSPGCHELVGSIFDFAQSLCALRFSESEVALFSALVLVNASRPWLQDRPRVARLQRHLDVAFRLLLRRTRREGLLDRLPPPGRLRALCSQHLEQLQAFRRLHPGGVSAAFPPLYRELFAPDAADAAPAEPHPGGRDHRDHPCTR